MASIEHIYNRLIRAAKDNGGEVTQDIQDRIVTLKESNWDDDDIYNYLGRTEEVQPNLPEDRALKAMEEISAKYKY
jgi:hypothetical protein